MKNYILHLFISLSAIGYINAQQRDIPIDSIYILRKLSRDGNTYTPKQRLAFAQRSYELAKLTKVDSTIMWSKARLANINFDNDNYDLFFKDMNFSLDVAKRLKDRKAISYYTSDLGIGYHYVGQNDSAYFYLTKALKYIEFNDPKNRHHIYQGLASIQHNYKLYIKSERNIIKSLESIDQYPETRETLDRKCDLYILLGIISIEQENFKESLKYYNKAFIIAKKMIKKGYNEGEFNQLIIFNNIAEAYQQQKDYTNSLDYYHRAIANDNSLKQDLSFYPLIISNIAYTKFLQDDKNVNRIISNLKIALNINDSLTNNYDKYLNIASSSLYLSKIYFKNQKKDSSYKYAIQAHKFSKSIQENKYVLESLLLLSDLEEGEAGKVHFKEYITLSDSINKEERHMRNKFARIEYDSNQLETDNKQLIKDKKWLYFIVSGILIITLLTYTLLVLRSKNKTLEFSKAQQKANEDIYSLMLVQQQKLEEGRLQERNRVSEELHDGILSKLFGTRLGLSFLELKGNTDDLIKFNEYLEQINILEKDLRDLSHNLKTSELKSENDFNNILNSLLNEQTNLHNIQYQLTNTALVNWNIVNDKIKVNIYRIIQEVLHNSIKHANAKTISLDFNTIDNNLELTINDDGKGFNVKQARKGIGLKNIASRIKTLKGTFNLDSELNKGTTIQISIPL